MKNESRHERKFVVESLTLPEVEAIIKDNPALFCEAFPERQVNNLYLDTENMDHYRQSVEGVSERLKVRIRWYGYFFGVIRTPALELKFKKEDVVIKHSFSLPSFSLDSSFTRAQLHELFQRSGLSPRVLELLKTCKLSLGNSYHRKYFVSAHRDYRVTIDTDLLFFRTANGNVALSGDLRSDALIVELKYGLSHDSGADRIANQFPFRLTKSSKYVRGIQLLNG